MKATRLLVVSGLAVAAVSANAQINLTNAGTFSLGGVFKTLGASPAYTPGSSMSTITINPTKVGSGSLNQWWFSVVDSSDITSVTYSITLSGITTHTKIQNEIMGYSYDGLPGGVGPQLYTNTGNFTFNIDVATGSTASTQTLNFTEFLTTGTNTDFDRYALPGGPFSVNTAFFKANFTVLQVVPEPTGIAALTVGALGLLIRRRRTK